MAEVETPQLEVVEIPDAQDLVHADEPLPDALPVLPLRENVTFPDTLTPLAVGQERSIKLVDDVLSSNRMLAMVASRDPENEEPGPDDLYEVGVAGTVARMLKVPDGSLRVLVQGGDRIRLGPYVAEDPYLVARVDPVPDEVEASPELEALTRNVQNTFSEIIEQIPYLPEELQLAVTNMDEPSALSHLIAGALRIPIEEKQELLEQVDVAKRLRRLSELLARELEVVRLGTKIQSEVESEIGKGQREYFLREQLKAIQAELGEGDEQQVEIAELRERIEAAKLPEDAHKQAERELGRLEKLPSAAAEYGVIRTYLEWLTELPWSKETEDNLEIKHARKVLDEDHYDLEEVKDRILEYLAVRKLNPDSPGLRRPPGRRQDQPGKVDRPRPRARVRADLGRGRPRRGGDPRPPPHLHRRDAGDDPASPARRRHPQSRLHDRRDRQDGRRLPGGSLQRHARGARPGPELELPRSLPRPPL
jgi:ATP-dependent Lon protease